MKLPHDPGLLDAGSEAAATAAAAAATMTGSNLAERTRYGNPRQTAYQYLAPMERGEKGESGGVKIVSEGSSKMKERMVKDI